MEANRNVPETSGDNYNLEGRMIATSAIVKIHWTHVAVSQNELDMKVTNISPRQKVTEVLRSGALLLFFRARPVSERIRKMF